MLIKRVIDGYLEETACDRCGRQIYIGEPVYEDDAKGETYCSKVCGLRVASERQFERDESMKE